MIKLLHSTLLIALLTPFALAHADTLPECLDVKGAIPVDNAQVLKWKTSTPNQFLARAHVSGTVEKIYPDKNGHNHFQIQIGPDARDTIEVVYNVSFGKLPKFGPGANIEACGDYITSDAATAEYPPSPDGAIMHWVHRNPKGHGHASGFVAIDGTVYGQGNGQGS